jgi:SNF2 family DNA or RNA helicase
VGITALYLDGATPLQMRAQLIERFQAGEADVFLISLKAGGTGINLTAADYVIHLDPWWNPAVEDQATDRAHRIGQTKPVTVYRLITRGTVEERILAMHRDKRALVSAVLDGTDIAGKLTTKDLLALLSDN